MYLGEWTAVAMLIAVRGFRNEQSGSARLY